MDVSGVVEDSRVVVVDPPPLPASSTPASVRLTFDSVVLLPRILALIGFLAGLVTSLAGMMTFWLGPLGPSVPSFTATPKDWPEVWRGIK